MSKKLFESRRKRLLNAMLKALESNFSPERDNIYHQIANDKKMHFLSLDINDEKRVSYAQKPEDIFEEKKRRKTTLARYINKECEHNLVDSELEKYCKEVITHIVDSSNYVKVEQGTVSERFLEEFGGHTCMTGKESQSKIILYDDNNVELVLYDDGKQKGRALLWTTDSGKKVMDRIYPNSGIHVDIMKEWAIKNDIVYRKSTGLAESEHIGLSDGKQHFVTVKHKNVFPYCDTFQYGVLISQEEAVLSNRRNFEESKFPNKYEFRLSNTDGRGPNVFFCSCCNAISNISDKNTKDKETLCNKCFQERYFVCMWCQEVYNKDIEKKEILLFDNECVCMKCADDFVECPECHQSIPSSLFETGETCIICEYGDELKEE